MSWNRLCRRSHCEPEFTLLNKPLPFVRGLAPDCRVSVSTSIAAAIGGKPLPHSNGIQPLISLIIKKGFLAIHPL